MKNYTVSIKPNFDTVKQSSIYPVGSDFAANQNYANGIKLTPATRDNLGGVVVGNNLVITEDGTLSAIGEGVAGVSSFNNRTQDITLNSKDVIDALGFSPTPYKLIPATDKVLGGVKVGGNLEVATDGTLTADIGVAKFNGRVGDVSLASKDVESALGFAPEKLAPASAAKLGGIKVGKNLTVEADGTLNAQGGTAAGVSSFNGRQGDVKLIAADVTDLVPKYDLPVSTDKILGGVIVGDNLTIDSKGRLSAKDVASGVESFNGRDGKVTLTTKDVTDVVDIPKPYELPIASKAALGGFKVGKNLTISADGVLDAEGGSGVAGVSTFNGRKGDVTLTSADIEDVQQIASKSSLGVVKVGRNLTIDPDGTLNSEGGSGDAGVSTFNGRKGDVTLVAKDVPIDNASIVINEKGELKAVGGGTPYTLPIASELALGGVKVGDNLTIDKNGRLNAKSGGGQGGSYRLILPPVDCPDWTNYYLTKNDLNGYVTVATGTNRIALVLPEDVYEHAGNIIHIAGALGGTAVFSASVNNYVLVNNGNSIKETGIGRLIYLGTFGELGEGMQLALSQKVEDCVEFDEDQRLWILEGDIDEENIYELSKPSIASAVVSDHQVTLALDLPDELIPVMGYDFDATSKYESLHYSFANDGRKEVVLDGLENMREYVITFHTFATCGDSPTSDPIKVVPQEPKPSAPTVLTVGGHWNGAKFNFAEPTDKAARIVSWIVKDEEGKTYPITEVEGDGLVHSGWFRTQEEHDWTLALAAVNESGIGEYSAFHKVYIGARQFVPNEPKFATEATILKEIAWTAPKNWGLEDGYTDIQIIASDLDGQIKDDVTVTVPKDTKSGMLGKLQCDHKYNLTARGIYPNGDTSPAQSVTFQMWASYIKEAPKSVTIDATKKDSIAVTVNDPCKPPCTGFEVWIGGHPIAKQELGNATLFVTKGYSGGIECLVQVRWIEVEGQFSDLDAGKRVIPSAPAPNVPKLGNANQQLGTVTIAYPQNDAGAAVQSYYLMVRSVGDQTWQKMDVTREVVAGGKATYSPRVSNNSVQTQYCGSAKNGSGESTFSDPQSFTAIPFMPCPSPEGGVNFTVSNDTLGISVDPNRFATGDFHFSFTGIIMKYWIDNGAVQTVLKPTDWKGSSGDWYGAQKGQTLHISFAAQTWGSVEGFSTTAINIPRT